MSWNGLYGVLSNDQEHAEYDDVYDEAGDAVYCDHCGTEIYWKDGIYICPYCGKAMDRAVFFRYIGATPPGPECLTCDNLYPGCMNCLYGHDNDLYR